MKYRIPELGDTIRLIADWTFPLTLEKRNETVYKFLPDRYDVPEWMLGVDWSKKSFQDAPVQIPGKPDGHLVVYVHGHVSKGMPIWFHKFPVKLTCLWSCISMRDVNSHAVDQPPKRFEYGLSYTHETDNEQITIPKGAELVVDRVYIRRGAAKFSSVSFKWPKQKARFFASLADVCKIEFEEE